MSNSIIDTMNEVLEWLGEPKQPPSVTIYVACGEDYNNTIDKLQAKYKVWKIESSSSYMVMADGQVFMLNIAYDGC
jgi:hypothetical protein